MSTCDECRGCWWQEGGLCYVDANGARDANGRSLVAADARCDRWLGKRESLQQVIPPERLVIASEQTACAGSAGSPLRTVSATTPDACHSTTDVPMPNHLNHLSQPIQPLAVDIHGVHAGEAL